MPNEIGDLIVSDTRLGVGTSENLSTLTVRAKAPYDLTGTVAKANGSTTVTGTSTIFQSQLAVGDRLTVPGGVDETRTVIAIASNTSLTVDSAFSETAAGQTAEAQPSAARIDDGTGNVQVVVNDSGNVGIGTIAPRGQLEVTGDGVDAGLIECPVGVLVHMSQESDAYQLVLATDSAAGGTCGMALWATALNDERATLSFTAFDGDDITDMFLLIGDMGVHFYCQFTSQPNTPADGDYTIDVHDHYVFKDAGAGCTVTLPAAISSIGRELYIYKSGGAGTITVAATASQINGAASQTIADLYGGLRLVSSGGMWFATRMNPA